MKPFCRWVVFSLALLAFLAPFKFGTPIILQTRLAPPDGFLDWVIEPWPNQIGFMFAVAALLWFVLDSGRFAARVDVLFVLPLVFLLTQAAATPGSINRQLSMDTLTYFAVCVLVFYAAAWYVRDGGSASWIFCGLALATLIVCVKAFRQGLGELQEAREFAALYLDPSNVPPDFLLKLTSNRVFAWFGGYPNALAGYLVVAFAPTLGWTLIRARNWNARVKTATLIFVGAMMVFCLVLTGSRGGVVAFILMLVAALMGLATGRARRNLAIAMVVVAPLAVWLAREQGLLRLGAESLEARRDYWRGAVAIARDHLWLGTGPGTFGSIYPKYKTATTEEAQLAHNSFLQMWSDSGVVAFVAFAALWLWAMRDALVLARQRRGDVAATAVCAALVGWSAHNLLDFDLYVPGVGIPAFLMLGVLQGLKDLPNVKPVTPQGGLKWLIAALCAAVVGAAVWMEGRSLAASYENGLAQQVERTDPALALDAARRAAKLVPHSAHYQAAAGYLAMRLGLFDDAVASYQAAVANDPYRASLHWRLAHALKAADGELTDEAIEQFRQAAQLNPTNKRYSKELETPEESVRQPPSDLLESPPAKDE